MDPDPDRRILLWLTDSDLAPASFCAYVLKKTHNSKNQGFSYIFSLPLAWCLRVLYLTRYSIYLNWQEEHPEDYRLVMRKDVVEKELADEDQNR